MSNAARLAYTRGMKALVTSPTLVEQVRDAVLDEIASGRWPAGSRVIQEQLAQQLGVSRQPVQQAMLLQGKSMRAGVYACRQHRLEIRGRQPTRDSWRCLGGNHSVSNHSVSSGAPTCDSACSAHDSACSACADAS